MKHLPDVTLVCVDTINYGKAIDAIRKSLEHITPARTIFFTDVDLEDKFEIVKIPTIKSKDEYSEFIIKSLSKYITTSHVLVIQADGYVLNGDAWNDEFLQYDYIGAPWLYIDGRNVGNGGFSLRSKRLQDIVATDDFIKYICPEDEAIARLYRGYLEKAHGIKYAPDDLAHTFSFELNEPKGVTFGFHGNFFLPYRKQVILKRTGAMGDIVMMEPVMERLFMDGYQVLLDIPFPIFQLFNRHTFPVFHSMQFPDAPNARVINLDMAYEVSPKQLVLKSYYEMCGITNGELRNPKLAAKVDAESKLFDKYVVFHIDDTAMPHRNIHGVDWQDIEIWFYSLGYTVIQIGTGKHRIGTKMNSSTLSMLTYIIAGADLFVGVDSGPAQIAQATGVKSVLFFGSVSPNLRYPDMSKIKVIQNPCEFAGCYHEVVSVRGQDCKFDVKKPPCITHKTENVINAIKDFL